jgi:hypothetical protein
LSGERGSGEGVSQKLLNLGEEKLLLLGGMGKKRKTKTKTKKRKNKKRREGREEGKKKLFLGVFSVLSCWVSSENIVIHRDICEFLSVRPTATRTANHRNGVECSGCLEEVEQVKEERKTL